jgi:hypothetical protein
VLWCVVPYELLEDDASPLLRLRALLGENGIDCTLLAPIESEGRHVVLARGLLRGSPATTSANRSINTPNLQTSPVPA